MVKRIRRIGSIKNELILKSREAALNAISIYNDPQVTFKTESFIVLMVIAWTYLLHAYYREKGIEYRFFKQKGNKRYFDKTKHGSFKYWQLEHCLNQKISPIDKDTSNNLRFLIGLRHEIEHQMALSIDTYISGRYQACALNFNIYLKKLFGDTYGIDTQVANSIQFSQLSEEQLSGLLPELKITKRLSAYISDFDGALSHEEYNSPHYSFRLIFKKKLVNRPGQADRVIEFIDPKSELAIAIDKEYWVKKEVERPKFRPTDVVAAVQEVGFPKFRIQPEHLRMWKDNNAKDQAKGYGVEVQGAWYWYQSWVDKCIELCKGEGDRYK